MKHVLLLALATLPLLRANELRINSVPAGYTMNASAFQIEPETHRARIVLRYTWPDTVIGGDTGPGLNSVPVQIDGLSYDIAPREIVYSDAGKRLVCATVHPRRFLFWSWSSIAPAGDCLVISRQDRHDVDTGWDHQRRETTDSFFETH